MNKDFLEITRPADYYRPVDERRRDDDEVERPLDDGEITAQARRCMDCGIPFCHGCGCPLENLIPEINRRSARGDWRGAWELLRDTSPLPEFTSRICPAPCEESCTASLEFGAVAIRQIEKAVVEHAFAAGLVTPELPAARSGRTVAVVGSGPAGLALALELNRAGHRVTVFERRELPGGLLRYGIPSFKLDKSVIDRRIALMREGGIDFRFRAEIGRDITLDYLAQAFDAVAVAAGTPAPRDLAIPGRELDHVRFALDFLNDGASAAGKNVVVIGGGDTGGDCVGMALRQHAASVVQLEIMPEPPGERSPSTPWPEWGYRLRTASSHGEGGVRRWSLESTRFFADAVEVRPVSWEFSPSGKPLRFSPAGKSERIPADLVLLALGFEKPVWETRSPNIFIAGDAATGQSLVVRAIADALRAVKAIHNFLEGK